MQKFNVLYDFVESAIRSRKYPPATASALKTALKLFEAELKPEEAASLDLFIQHFEQIYRDVCTKNSQRYSASSLSVYKSRVLKVIGDYTKYGIDPTKMAGWSPRVIVRGPKSKSASKTDMAKEPMIGGSEFNSSFTFEFSGGIRLLIPRNKLTSEAIADGELKAARTALTEFANRFMNESMTE
jgi:hypothetical protein